MFYYEEKEDMKKTLLIGLVLVLAVGALFVACSKKAGTDGNTIYVLGPTPDHGWTGSAARFAQEKVNAMNAAGGKYRYVFRGADGPDRQIEQIQAILAESQKPAGIVMQPSDFAVTAAVEQIAQADIPFILFDRLLDERSPIIKEKALVGMSADNYAIGAGAAYYFVGKGLNPGEAIWELPGDNSAVTVERSTGFREYLLGTRTFIDDQGLAHNIEAGKKWTQAQIGTITTAQVANWSRDNAKQIFESYITGRSAGNLAKWLFAHDDEFAMGILEFLQTPAQTVNRQLFEANVKVLTGCGGLLALYDVMLTPEAGHGNKIYQPDTVTIMSPTCRPGFFQDAIQLMADYLDGKDITVLFTDKAAKRYLEPPHLVDTDSWAAHQNDANWKGFD
jgi:ribose transport system substrate-binding protein